MTEPLRAAFQSHPSPTTPFSNSKFVPRYEDRKTNTEAPAPKDGSPLAQVNLRVGSMPVSKWLTFGHVLFSDVRHELVPVEGSIKRHLILMIYGLGNDDWPFYTAETYLAATFFNLSPRIPPPEELKIRRLKERTNEKTPDTSLGSTADLVVRLLGKVGFTTIKAARVGVPVASSVTRSDSKADKGKAAAEKKNNPPSLSEMMSDNSPLLNVGIPACERI
ncbi:hypothetical protein FOQG_14666 [Fusarium oxysporum f. sp. raphani 54005]|uniref:Uncharacterized protein n=2 Tax=Fusarium oxysporum TaxID=5507 RepID=X0BQY7_FUSOX|nr:hypothetical protein FOMG_18004 [Fusarium oxysporum f. sp. melonis 26406]EXK80894.1 hypothetical protein FOQG_14666 [Fusarium oxysporum f. sp. raphani 54005]